MAPLRLITWNCHHGSLASRVKQLARETPDIAFLQEYRPGLPSGALAKEGSFITRAIRPSKGVGLGAMSERYRLTEITPAAFPSFSDHAIVAAEVSGPIEFIVIGLWARGPNYAVELLKFLESHHALLHSAPVVVMGDLNMGSKLGTRKRPTHRSKEVLASFADAGLASAYHAFHSCAHGHEAHATYRHLFKRRQPWHIDFCFVPESWRTAITDVAVLDSRAWAKRSDHSPLRVSLGF